RALGRRRAARLDELRERGLLGPPGRPSPPLPRQDDSARGRLSPEHTRRAVQGYSDSGEPLGEPGSQESYYRWPGTGQMYSSARDMALFLAANLGELPVERSLREAMNLAHQDVWIIGP